MNSPATKSFRCHLKLKDSTKKVLKNNYQDVTDPQLISFGFSQQDLRSAKK